MQKYKLIPHTSDIGIEAYGKDLKDIFVNAAFGMFDVMADLKMVNASQGVPVKCKAANAQELLVAWLRELLYQFNGGGILLKEFIIDKIDDKNLIAKAGGEKYDPKRHSIKKEIKAVTYHNLKIEKTKNGLKAQIIFDV